MSQLQTYLEAIKQMKETDLIPQNIPQGKTLFNVSGRYKIDGTSISFYHFISSIDQQADLTNIINSIDFSKKQNFRGMFYNCSALTTVPLFDTSNATTMQEMFRGCTNLTTVPVLDTSNIYASGTYMENMFTGCTHLNSTSLNNILEMCINAKNGNNKYLVNMGITSNNYPASLIQSLPNYQAFINAGWAIGY